MNNTNVIVTSSQVSYILEIIDAMQGRCDPYLSLIIRKTFEENSTKLQSADAQEAIADILEEFALDE
jgi:hypothetical protein